jgi:RNA polymerase subunit RPABC4/transcription elongation factor Spt4
MKLINSRLCLDCEEVHEDQHCPVCSSESFAFMTRWVTPSDTAAAETARQTRPPEGVERRQQLAKREQVDAYRQILNPTQPARRGRMVAGGALGLALIGVARMLWRAAPNPKEGDGKVVARDRQSGKGMN